jgi:hypothetical protein
VPSRSTPSRLRRGLLLGCLTALLVALVPSASAKVVRGHDRLPVAGPRPVTMRPPQALLPVDAGKRYVVPVILTNFTRSPVTLQVTTRDLEAADDPDGLVQPRRGAPTRAGTWLHPELSTVHLGVGERVRFDVVVDVPADAHPGLWAAAVVAYQTLAAPTAGTAGADASRVTVVASLASEFLLTVRGAVRVDAHVRDSSGPRLVIHGSRPTFHAVVTNDGNSLVDGKVRLELASKLAANADVSVRSGRRLLVLPGGRRTVRFHWQEPPWIGWYQPTVRLDYAGSQANATLPTVFVLPPWWVALAIAVAIVLPLWARRRRRRRRELLLEQARMEREGDWDDDEA